MKTNHQPHWALSDIAEQQAPAASVDLWKRIQTRLETHAARAPRALRLSKPAAVGLALTLLLVGAFFFTPAARAFAETIIQRLGIAFAEPRQFENTTIQQAASATRSAPLPSLSEEELRRQAPFALALPAWLPDGLNHIQRDVRRYDPKELAGSGVQVSVEYARRADFDPEGGVLYLRANDGPISSPPLLAESKQQVVTVNGQAGLYVHGGWQNDGRGDPNTRLGSLQWDDAADDAYLTWQQGEVIYLLEAHNLGLGLEEMMKVAESIR